MNVIGTAWALLPPLVAIVLALITKEVYSSLFLGILVGGVLYAGFSPEGTMLHIFGDAAEGTGFIGALCDPYNMGILIFLVMLGAIVQLMNKAGGSAAFGRWASEHIKTRVGAQLATIAFGVLIFVDDYFNCLTVGSVMRPVTDKHKISRAKLAYLIDATAAPICIIAPISSWAAAVSGSVDDGNGFLYFLKAIPYNYYALLTIVMMVAMALMKLDFGSMARHERNAMNGDLFTTPGRPYENATGEEVVADGKRRAQVRDLVVPVIALIVFCVLGMLYSGGIFTGAGFIDAFSNSDASVGLALGSFFGLVFTIIWYLARRILRGVTCMSCIPEGFKAMVPAILILTFAWTLKNMTNSLELGTFVNNSLQNAGALMNFLPAIVFIIGCVIAFASGTSWGTFSILIPIVVEVFAGRDDRLMIIAISACMAGAVCGDHCSPISDTTIMSSAGAQCEHVNHVSTQLPYAIVAAVVSFVTYLIAGFVQNAAICLVIGIALMLLTLFGIKWITRNSRPSGDDGIILPETMV